VNEKGDRIGVLLSLEDYKSLLDELEELESLRAYDAAKAPVKNRSFSKRPPPRSRRKEMTYSILILPRASKELAKLSGGHYERVRDAIRSLSDDPRPSGCLKLRGREWWRIRVGDYRR